MQGVRAAVHKRTNAASLREQNQHGEAWLGVWQAGRQANKGQGGRECGASRRVRTGTPTKMRSILQRQITWCASDDGTIRAAIPFDVALPNIERSASSLSADIRAVQAIATLAPLPRSLPTSLSRLLFISRYASFISLSRTLCTMY
jgi:hypothetical protein